MADQESIWDRDYAGPGTRSVWDRDWDGPGTESRWDLVPAIIGRSSRVVWGSIRRRVAWVSARRRVKW